MSDALCCAVPVGAAPDRWGVFALRRQIDLMRERNYEGLHPLAVKGFAHPVWVRSGTSDLEVAEQLFTQHELGFDLVEQPRWIIDLGANIGLSAVYFAHRFPRARILAVEMEPANFRLLQKNCEPYPQITPIQKAVWGQAGRVKISNPDAQPWSFRVEPTHDNDSEGVDAVSINELMRHYAIEHIDLLKMDIEGAEREVLSTNPYPWVGKTTTLAIELHERHRPGCEAALAGALRDLPHTRSLRGEYELVRFVIA
jgi:FkbM family methyltransferase